MYSIDFYYNNFISVIYNICSIFLILTNQLIPMYTEEILYFNNKVLELISINYKINNEKKKEVYIKFVNNLIEKNQEIINKIQKEKDENENLNNYIIDNDYTTSEDSSEDSSEDKDKN